MKLASQLTSSAGIDQLLAKVLSHMEDGSGMERPIVSMSSLLDQLQPSVLPLLPQQADFFPKAERLELSHACVKGVVNVNTHGDSSAALQAKKRSTSENFDKLSLYPAVSMINHSNDPNGVLLPLFKEGEMIGMAVSARRPIPKSAELTLAYLDDPQAVKAKWGIEG